MMNERIQELGVAAGLIVEEWDGFNRRQLNPAEQKFAELIVRECLGCCEQVISDPVPESVDTWLNGGSQCIDEIKQHFGVEKRIETKKYKILEPIVLGFLGQYDTQDRMVSSKDGYLKFDHKNVIFVDNNGVEEVSITTNNVIDIWLIQNKIQEFGVDE